MDKDQCWCTCILYYDHLRFWDQSYPACLPWTGIQYLAYTVTLAWSILWEKVLVLIKNFIYPQQVSNYSYNHWN